MNNKCLIGVLLICISVSTLMVLFYDNIVNIYNIDLCQCKCQSGYHKFLYSHHLQCLPSKELTDDHLQRNESSPSTASPLKDKDKILKTFIDGLVTSVSHLKDAKRNIKTLAKAQAYVDLVKAMSEIVKSFKTIDPVHSSYLIPDIKTQPTHKLVVCPEIYKGTKFGWPFYDKGFEIGECNDVAPLNSVVQILINTMEYPDKHAKELVNILKGIEKVYPGVTVHVASRTPLPSSAKFDNIHVFMYTDLSGNPGHIWNILISKVTTAYFLLARDIYYFHWYARIERMLRIASSFDVKVVAGAGRNVEGHWRISCHQQTLKNYTLRYIDGYDVSRNACLVCDHVTGPFVAKTDFIKNIPFDEELPDKVVFEDFFMRLKRVNVMVMACPDSMYFMLTTESKYNSRETWLPLAKKWSLNRLHHHDGQTYQYSCEEAGITCEKTPGIGIPPCCLEQRAKNLHDVMKLCEESKIICEVSTGQILGAIKFNAILPWSWQDNLVYVSANHSVLKGMAGKLKDMGYKMSEGEPKAECCEEGTSKIKGGHFDLEKGVWNIGLSGIVTLSSEHSLSNNMKTTKVNVNGVWVQAPHNPVHAARTLYGSEVFKHNEEYDRNSRCKAKVGHFCKCPYPFHHACLDHFLDDGNIQFKIP